MSASNDKPVLTYWKCCGLAAAPRIALIHGVGVDGFVDLALESIETYMEKKNASHDATPIFNIPCIEFPGSPLVTQSNAVLKAVGRRYNLNGETLAEQDTVDELLCHFTEFTTEYNKMTYGCSKDQFPEYRASFNAKSFPYYIGGLDHLLEQRKTTFIAGEHFTVADIRLWTFVEKTRVLNEQADRHEVIKAYPRLLEWLNRVEQVEAIRKYIDSHWISWPQNGVPGNWSAQPKPPKKE
jgi:glutathione S-transferase